MKMTFGCVMDNIREAMSELDDEQVAEIHNHICLRNIECTENNVGEWEYSGEDDNKS